MKSLMRRQLMNHSVLSHNLVIRKLKTHSRDFHELSSRHYHFFRYYLSFPNLSQFLHDYDKELLFLLYKNHAERSTDNTKTGIKKGGWLYQLRDDKKMLKRREECNTYLTHV